MWLRTKGDNEIYSHWSRSDTSLLSQILRHLLGLYFAVYCCQAVLTCPTWLTDGYKPRLTDCWKGNLPPSGTSQAPSYSHSQPSVGPPVRLLCVTLTHWVYSKGLSNFQGEGEFWWQSERPFPASLLVGDLFIHLRVTTENGRCDRKPTPPPIVIIHTYNPITGLEMPIEAKALLFLLACGLYCININICRPSTKCMKWWVKL